jgi:hypothetical protein
MKIHRPLNMLYFTSAVFVLISFSLLRSFAADGPRPLKSLTVAERTHLPDDTRVTLEWTGPITLGQLRQQHANRMANFRQASAWGKAAGATLRVPSNGAPGQPNGGGGLQNNPPPGGGAAGPTRAIQPSATPSAVSKNAATLPGQQPKQGGGLGGGIQPTQAQPNAIPGQRNGGAGGGGLQKSPAPGGGGATSKNSAPQPNGVMDTHAVPANLFLVPLQKYQGPIPAGYSIFCDAAQVSACIYLPPNTTFLVPRSQGLSGLAQGILQAIKGDVDQFVADVDPIITDQSFCGDWGGRWDAVDQVCVFVYPIVQQTKFKPGATPVSSAACGQPSSYQIDPKLGTITVSYFVPYTNSTFTTGSTPVSCMVKAWMYP